MSHDDFESERSRVERVLEILEHGADRLDSRAHVPLMVLKDAVAFVQTSENAAHDAVQSDDSEPVLSACIAQHKAARGPLAVMGEALGSLERGDASAAARFARAAREYVELRRTHLRLDDRLFARAPKARRAHDHSIPSVEHLETADASRLYDRLVEAAAILDVGVATAFSRRHARRGMR